MTNSAMAIPTRAIEEDVYLESAPQSQPHWDFAPGKHIPALDGLRGLAIGLVVCFHTCGPLFGLGWIGVDLFFVLSGFLITGILLDSQARLASLRSFFIRRSLRIFPLYYLTLFCAYAIAPFLAFTSTDTTNEFARLIREEPWYWLYMQNWVHCFRGWPENKLFAHFWSLAVEEQFYILWPFIVIFGKRSAVLASVACAIPLSIGLRMYGAELFGWQYPYYYTCTLCRMDALMIGAALAVGVRHWPHGTRLSAIGTGFIGAAVLVVLLWLSDWNCGVKNKALSTFGYTAIDTMFGGVLIGSMISSPLNVVRRVCLLPLFQGLGKYSYAIYVIHWPLHLLLHSSLQPALGGVVSATVAKGIAVIAGLLITLIGAKISYELWEKPFISLKRFFT